jgi:hypothetical protein
MADQTKGETQTWWRVSTYFDMGKIEACEVVRETTAFVTYLDRGTERREGKDTEYYKWLPTEIEAIAYARALLMRRRDRFLAQFDSATAALAAFNEAHPLPVAGDT